MTKISLNGKTVEIDNFNTKENMGLSIVVVNVEGQITVAQSFDT